MLMKSSKSKTNFFSNKDLDVKLDKIEVVMHGDSFPDYYNKVIEVKGEREDFSKSSFALVHVSKFTENS